MRVRPRLLCWVMNVWPPFVGAGIRVRHIAADWREAHVTMRLTWYNRNYVRTHFGGSLYAMTDPFFMIMLLYNLGDDYLVWDKSGSIEYVAPGRGTVSAHFHLSEKRLQEIRAGAAGGGKILPEFEVNVKDEAGAIVAKVRKVLYVRLKPRKRPQ
jgi:acyl-coenzyme A thioesterase PaaI-like protein